MSGFFVMPGPIQCDECGVFVVTGPADSRLAVPNRLWLKCPSRHCGKFGKRYLFDLPKLVVTEVVEEGQADD